MTIHKSQGSEYPAVVIPVMTRRYAILQRNLLYTGLTRGKRLIVLVLATIVAHAATLLRQHCRPNASPEPRQLLASGWPLVPAPLL